MNRRFKGIWIPRGIWLREDLSTMEKVMLAELNSLEDPVDGCYASNEYLAKFFKCSERNVGKVLLSLETKGLIIRDTEIKTRGSLRKIRTNFDEYLVDNLPDSVE